MSAERQVEVGVPPELRKRRAAELDEELLGVVQRVWSDLGLPSRPQVAVTDGEVGVVTVDGLPVVVSARRIEQAVLAGSGAARRAGEPLASRELLVTRLEELDPSAAVQVMGCVVDTALRANASGRIRADSEAIAQYLIEAGGTAAPRLEAVREAVTLAAEHGGIPRPVAGVADLLGDAADEGPDGLAERLVQGWLVEAPPQPTIEAHPATLRRLTTGERRFRREHMANPRAPRGLMNDLFLDYGVRPPAVSLRAVDQRESVVRFRFGASSTATHLVLADSQAVLTVSPELLPPGSGARPFIDPAYGETWSLVELPLNPAWPPAIVLDPAAVVARALLTEMKTRLALWSPTWEQLPTFSWAWVDRDRLHLDEAGAALRWLLSAQASVHLLARLTEAVVEAAAEGLRGPAAIAGRLRSMLGRSLLGPLDTSFDYTPLGIDSSLASEAIERQSPSRLLNRHPELTSTIGQLVVSVPSPWRRELECLLRPLSDTAVVIANEELDLLPLSVV